MLYTLGNVLMNLNKFIKYAKKYVPVSKLIGLKQDSESLKLIIELHVTYPKLIKNLNFPIFEKNQLYKFLRSLISNNKSLEMFVNNLWIINKQNILKNNYNNIHKVIV